MVFFKTNSDQNIYTKNHQTASYFQNFLRAALVIHDNMFSKNYP